MSNLDYGGGFNSRLGEGEGDGPGMKTGTGTGAGTGTGTGTCYEGRGIPLYDSQSNLDHSNLL